MPKLQALAGSTKDRAMSSEEKGGAQSSADSAEKIEDVLNQGVAFLSGVMEMATGEKLGCADVSKRLVKIDRTTGEVTLKFTLPGFIKT